MSHFPPQMHFSRHTGFFCLLIGNPNIAAADLFGFTVFGLSGGFACLIFSGMRDTIESAETLSWQPNLQWAAVGLGVGAAFAVGDNIWQNVFSFWIRDRDIMDRFIPMTLIVGIPGVLVGLAAGGLRRSETVDNRTRPNQGIWKTLFSALRLMIVFAIAGAFIGTIFDLMSIVLQNNLSSVPIPCKNSAFEGESGLQWSLHD